MSEKKKLQKFPRGVQVRGKKERAIYNPYPQIRYPYFCKLFVTKHFEGDRIQRGTF